MVEPQEPVETLHEDYHKRKPAWARVLIQEAKRYGAPDGMQRERKRPKSYNNYAALLCDIIDKEPPNYEEVAEKKEWKDAMIEEYQSTMKKDVWSYFLDQKRSLS